VREVALVGEPLEELVAIVRERHRPDLVLAGARATEGTAVPLLEGRATVGGAPAAYVCERFACQAPVSEPAALAALLDRASPAPPR
jgi:hypothetical protein